MRRAEPGISRHLETNPFPEARKPGAAWPLQASQAIKVVVAAELCPAEDLERCFTPEAGYVLVSYSSSASKLMSYSEAFKPCVLVVDHSLLRTIAAEEFSRVTDGGRSVLVLVCVAQPEPRLVENLLRLGCVGYLTLGFTAEHLQRAVEAVVSGELWVGHKLTSAMLREYFSVNSGPKLTPREEEILTLIGCGLSNRRIAEKLNISRETVRWHERSLYAKTSAPDRSHLASLAARCAPLQKLAIVEEPPAKARVAVA